MPRPHPFARGETALPCDAASAVVALVSADGQMVVLLIRIKDGKAAVVGIGR